MLTGGDSQSMKSTTPSSNEMQSRLEKMLSFEWLGQTLASFCWIAAYLSMVLVQQEIGCN